MLTAAQAYSHTQQPNYWQDLFANCLQLCLQALTTCCPSTCSLHGLPCRPSLSCFTLHGMQQGFDAA